MRNLRCVASRLRSTIKNPYTPFFTNHGPCRYSTQPADSPKRRRKVQLRGLPEEITGAIEAIRMKKAAKNGGGKLLYLVDKEAAKKFAALVVADSQGNSSYVIEINSGLGYLSKELLEGGISSINMFESVPYLIPNLTSIVDSYPGRATFRPFDFLNICSLGYLDWKNNTEKAKPYLSDIEKRAWEEEPAVQIIGALTDMLFIRRLMSTIIFQNTLAKLGRMVLHVAIPPSVFAQLTATNEHYDLYRWYTVLFQCIFDIKLLGCLPRTAFYPHHREQRRKRYQAFCRAKIMGNDRRFMNVVKIEPKADLFKDNFTVSDLAPFYYFLHHHLKSRSNRVIPALEKWVPGCGRTLILHGFTIFTEFGELTPAQIMDLFKLFRSWPEFKNSSFVSCMDSFLMRVDEHMLIDTNSDNLEEMFQFSLDEGHSPLE